jgi:hypothetical protein
MPRRRLTRRFAIRLLFPLLAARAWQLTSADKRDDFDPVSLGQRLLDMLSPRHQLQIHFNSDMARGQSQLGQQLSH